MQKTDVTKGDGGGRLSKIRDYVCFRFELAWCFGRYASS